MGEGAAEVMKSEEKKRGLGKGGINSVVTKWVHLWPLHTASSLHLLWPSWHCECSRGEDYRLIKLPIIDYNSCKKQAVVVECRGHHAAWFQNIDHAHGWEKDVVGMVEEKHWNKKIMVSFECETLKSEDAAEEHIKKFIPKLAGLDAVVNIGKMSISGLDFDADTNIGETSISGLDLDADAATDSDQTI